MEGLSTKVLLGIDIIYPEGINLLVSKRTAYISSCKVYIPIEVFIKGPFIKRVVYTKTRTTLLSYSIATIAIYYLDLLDRDFFFKLKDTKLSIYIGLINNGFTLVLVKNDTE